MSASVFHPLLTALLMVAFLIGCNAPIPDATWRLIQEQGIIRVGMDTNWVPFEYVDGTGQLAGLDVELAREVGERLGLEVQFIGNLGYDGLYDALTAGRADVVISAVVVDVGRSADFAFSTPYFDAGQVLVVGPQNTPVKGFKDLEGQVVAVELGSEGDRVARRWARRLYDLSLLHTDSADDSFSAVILGEADAALTDRATALMALKRMRGQESTSKEPPRQTDANSLYIGGGPITDEQYAVVVLKESDDLLRAINATLADMQRDGTLEELERKWLGP